MTTAAHDKAMEVAVSLRRYADMERQEDQPRTGLTDMLEEAATVIEQQRLDSVTTGLRLMQVMGDLKQLTEEYTSPV